MAVLLTLKYKCGNMDVTARFHDDALVGVPQDEINRRIAHMKEVARRIVVNAELRKLKEESLASESK